MRQIVITHPEMGIFLGQALGMGFWSKCESAGQIHAAAFPDEKDAREFVRSWLVDNEDGLYGYCAVDTGINTHAADIEALKAAGLSDMLGDMEANLQQYEHVQAPQGMH